MSARFNIQRLSFEEARSIALQTHIPFITLQRETPDPDGPWCVSWPVDLNARAPLSPLDAISELRLSQKGTLAILGYPDELQGGFRNFASIDSRAFTDPTFRADLRATLHRTIDFLYGLYVKVVTPPAEIVAPTTPNWMN